MQRSQDFSEQIDLKALESIRKLAGGLRNAGFDCYLVGGSVRDLLMSRPAKDYDFATNARPEQVRKIFKRTIPTGIKHGTITVLLDSEKFEVTTYRSEGLYSDARHPDTIAFAETLEEDLSRRDFTVNALAWDPDRKILVDMHGGLDDLRDCLIRTIGKPEERFFEDGLRTIRACRFAASLEFEIEEKTRLALSDPAIQARTSRVAVERFSDELWKGMKSREASRMILALEKSGLRSVVFGGAAPGRYESSRDALKKIDTVRSPELRMAAWWMGIGLAEKEQMENLAKHLRFSGRQIQDLKYFRSHILFAEKERTVLETRAYLSELKEKYRQEAVEFLELALEWPSEKINRESLLKTLRECPLILSDLRIRGEDLVGIGYHGTQIGKVLRSLLESVWEEPGLNERDRLRNLAVERKPGIVPQKSQSDVL